jgi:hypothetical protein
VEWIRFSIRKQLEFFKVHLPGNLEDKEEET